MRIEATTSPGSGLGTVTITIEEAPATVNGEAATVQYAIVTLLGLLAQNYTITVSIEET